MKKEKTSSKEKEQSKPSMLGKKTRQKKSNKDEDNESAGELDVINLEEKTTTSRSRTRTSKLEVANINLPLSEKKSSIEKSPILSQLDPLPKNYEILGHKNLNGRIVISYKVNNGNPTSKSLSDIKFEGFYDALVKYCNNEKVTKVDKKLLMSTWESANPKVEPLIPFDKLGEDELMLESKPKDDLNEAKDKIELASLKKKFVEYYNEFVYNQTDDFVNWVFDAYNFITKIEYNASDYRIHINYNKFYKYHNPPRNIKDSLEGCPIPMFHPILIFNMYQYGELHNLPLLKAKASNLFEKYYNQHLDEIQKKINIINGASLKVDLLDDYMKHATVSNFLATDKIKDVNNVYGFRRYNQITGVEGYLKYYLIRSKSRFIYFSYDDIYTLLGYYLASKIISTVENSNPNEESGVKAKVSTLKHRSLYKKSNLRQYSRIKLINNNDYTSNLDCFYNAIEQLAGEEIINKSKLCQSLRNKDLESEINIANDSNLGFILSQKSEETGILSEVVSKLKEKSLVVFDVGNFKSHTIAFIPEEPVKDRTFQDLANENLKVTVYELFDNKI